MVYITIFAFIMKTSIKILIIRFSSIGDIVLTTPVARCLQQLLDGEVELHFLTKNQYKGILISNPRVIKVYGIDKSTNEVISDLQSERYDYVIDLHKNLRSKRVIRKLKVLSFDFEKLNYQKWLMTTFKINKLPAIHIVERYLNAVKSLGIENDGLGLEYYIPENDKVDLKTLPISHQNGYVSFTIGAQHNTKRSPIEKMCAILKQLNLPVVLLGGKEDAEDAIFIKKSVGDNVFIGCGNYNLNQSASLVQQSKVLLTHDTGLMHIGAALGVNIVSVWGNTIPEFGMTPYYGNKELEKQNSTIVEVKDLKCRPCSKLGYHHCPKKHFKCMKDIDESVILNAI